MGLRKKNIKMVLVFIKREKKYKDGFGVHKKRKKNIKMVLVFIKREKNDKKRRRVCCC